MQGLITRGGIAEASKHEVTETIISILPATRQLEQQFPNYRLDFSLATYLNGSMQGPTADEVMMSKLFHFLYLRVRVLN
jgi:hypothetical protein